MKPALASHEALANASQTSAPYVDLQVNGYVGVDFNSDDLTPDSMHVACQRMRDDGVDAALATIITAEVDVMMRRLRRLADLRQSDAVVAALIAGLHVEGPFISPEPGYVGAHPAADVRPATLELAARIVDAGCGLVKLFTLAPEQDSDGAVTRWLANHGVRVSAGHCNPSLDQLCRAIDDGVSMFTHLGNGCPLVMHRHDNIIQRVLSVADRLWVCFIADGVHVPAPALKNYLAVVGDDRAIIVSDAMAAAALGPGSFTLGNQRVVVDDRLATWSEDRSHLVGSACTMRQMHRILSEELELSSATIQKLTSTNPRCALLGMGTL
jgi:N-acetylglucosamine-6-phosphate deacetylase